MIVAVITLALAVAGLATAALFNMRQDLKELRRVDKAYAVLVVTFDAAQAALLAITTELDTTRGRADLQLAALREEIYDLETTLAEGVGPDRARAIWRRLLEKAGPVSDTPNRDHDAVPDGATADTEAGSGGAH